MGRTRRCATAAALLVAVLPVLGAAGPARAQSVTFVIASGSLAIAEPSAATLSGTGPVTGSLGSTTVTDLRGGTTGWTSRITGTTAFSNGTTTVPIGNVSVYIPTLGITTTGVVVATTSTSAASPLTLSASAQALVTGTAVVGNNSATFNPSVSVTLPGNATAGTYTGVLTQTVS